MKTHDLSTESITNGQFKKAARLGFSVLAAALGTLFGSSASASTIDLGAAGGYSVLTYNSSNNSDSAFQGGPIGVVNGNWTQSGGGATNTQQPTTVYVSSWSNSVNFGGSGGSGPETKVVDPTRLNAAWSAATNLSANLSSLTPTLTLGSISTNTNITETAVGNYVLSISDINLNHPATLTLSAPAGSTFVLNISGSVTINGDSGSGLRIAGGLTTSDVVYNMTGSGTVLHTAGGGNGSVIDGIVLATNGFVQLSPGGVNGEIIAQTFQSSSGTIVSAPTTAVPEISSAFPLLAVLGLVIGLPWLRRKFAVA